MPTTLAFKTEVMESGYEWVPPTDWWRCRVLGVEEPRWRWSCWNPLLDKTPQLLLQPKSITEAFGGARTEVRPTEKDSSLFRNFARLEPSPESIVSFANEFGPLLNEYAGDPFSEWEADILAMRYLIEVWDSVEARKSGGVIAEHFRASDAGYIRCPYINGFMNYRGYRPGANDNEAMLWDKRGKPLEVARLFVMDAINRRLGGLAVALSFDAKEANGLAIKPTNLNGALWIQFANSVNEEKKYRQCKACWRWMELTIGENRADRQYCSNACRNRGLRMRQKRAIEMHAAGKKLKEIAAELDSDTATVKKWLAPKKGK